MKKFIFAVIPLFAIAVIIGGFTPDVMAHVDLSMLADSGVAMSAVAGAMSRPTLNERIDQKIQDAPNVALSNTAVWKLPIGRRFHELQCVIGGTSPVLTDISEIRVIANEKVIHRYSATERDAMNQFDGRAAWDASTNPTLVIPFERYNLENSVAEQESAIDTGPVVDGTGRKIRSLTLEMDLTSGFPADGTIKVYATQSLSLGRGAGTVMHVTKDLRTAAGSGEAEFYDLPYNSVIAQALNRVFIGISANDISELKIDRDNRTIFERTKVVNSHVQTDGIRTPQSGYYVVDRTEKGQVGNRINLVGVQDFRYKATMTGAATLTFLSEYLGALGD